jgi:hypothetical protein
MTITKERLNKMTSVDELIDITETIRYESLHAYYKNGMKMNQEMYDYEALETYAYELAVKHSMTADELEKCAVALEEDAVYCDNPDEWADNIRIRAYGLIWYLKEQVNSGCHQVFKQCLQENGLVNPIEELEIALNNIR